MAGMAAKMILGDKIKSVQGEIGLKEENPNKEEDEEQARLVEEARAEQEAERKAKHDKMEAEREVERQRIRDKYGLKKKEELAAEVAEDPDADNRISRKKKTPEEMAAEIAADNEEPDFMDTVMSYINPLRERFGF